MDALKPGKSICHHGAFPEEASAMGLAGSVRGSLGHRLKIERGRIPTASSSAPPPGTFPPRNASGTPGALEQALVGAPVAEGETVPLAVQHVVRSFNPCMVCTVH